MKNQEIIDSINERVIDGLKEHGMEWFKPFKAGEFNQPMNRITKRLYTGFNVFFLHFECRRNNWEHNQWMTFKQASSNGGRIIKGSKSTEVHFYSVSYLDTKTGKFVKDTRKIDLSNKRYKKIFGLRVYRVFNIAQIEGIEPLSSDVDVIDFTPNEKAEEIVNGYFDREKPLTLNHTEDDKCFYSPTTDSITMTLQGLFVDSDSYYKTLFHEMSHSSGHKDRLNRKTLVENKGMHGDNETYSKEELVAEVSSLYLTGIVGLEPKDNSKNSQAYLNGWIKFAEEDKKGVMVHAMTQTSKTVNYILG